MLRRASGRIGVIIVRNYNLLWGVWAVWGLLVAGWLVDIHMDLPALFYGKALAVVLGLALPALMVWFYKTKRNRLMSSFDENKNAVTASQEAGEIKYFTESLRPVSPPNGDKDTVISQGAQIAGEVKAAGNITVEGHVIGDLFCENTIKVENSGKVIGEIKARKIIIDGYVDGRLEACSVSVLAQGKVVGDIFSDELSIERGGVFNGQANPSQQNQERSVYAQGGGYSGYGELRDGVEAG